MKRLRKSVAALAAVAVMLCLAVRAEAVPITYTIFGTGSGTLDTTAFTDAVVTVTATGDTTAAFPVSAPPSPFNGTGNFLGPITIHVAGFGSATLVGGGFAFSDQDVDPPGVGIAGFDALATILGTVAAAFLDYDLTTAIGPTVGAGVFRSDAFFSTTLWTLNLTSIGNTTFEATIASEVPLPAALPLFASGLGALGLLGWRRRSKRTTGTAA